MTTTNTEAFNTLRLRPELLASVASLNYTKMTSIQMGVLPNILNKADMIAQAETGSGKTAAFALGLLNKLDTHSYTTQALVLCPTRGLSDQVAAETRRLASAMANTKVLTLCGSRPMQSQRSSLKHAPHVIVGTLGRILKHLEKKTLRLSDIATLVLDEADRVLDMGFQGDIMKILSATRACRQTLLFSATYPAQIKEIS